MPRFKYAALDASGNKVAGVMEAASAVRVRNDLVSRDLEVVGVKERKRFTQIEITKQKVKPADLMNFSRQLAAFLRAGIPILDALRSLIDEVSNAVFRQVLVDIADTLASGVPLAEAMATHDQLFPRYYVGILRSAELTGNLDTVLDQLAAYIERDLEAKRAVKSALMYPMVIMGMAVVTVAILVGWVLPKFEDFFAGFDAKLPLPTRMLLDASRFLGTWWPVILSGVVTVAAVVFLMLRTEQGRYRRDRLLLGLPVLGDVVRYAVVERFCRILGSMLQAGVAVPDAMDAAAEGTNNRVYERALRHAREQMLQGAGLTQPIAATGLFPSVAAQMFRVGEESGSLDRQLVLAADFYGSELSHRLKRLTTLFEPLVITVMGVIVGFVAIALVSAMYGIFNQAHIQ